MIRAIVLICLASDPGQCMKVGGPGIFKPEQVAECKAELEDGMDAMSELFAAKGLIVTIKGECKPVDEQDNPAKESDL